MTSRERIQCALNHRQPDRTPIFEYVLLPPVASRILARPYADYCGGDGWAEFAEELGWERALREYAISRLDIACALGHDMLYVVPNPLPPADAPLPVQPEEPPDDPVERVRRRTEAALARPAEVPDECLLVYRYLKEGMLQRDIDMPILAPAWGHGIWTDTDLMQTMLIEPEVAHLHFRLTTRNCLACVERYVELGIDQIGVGGDFAGNRPLISPECYRTFIVPEIRKMTQRIHEAGCLAVNASDGNLWPVIEDFLIGCDVDGYCEIDEHAGMSLSRLKELYGDRITFYGDLDCGNVLSFGTEEEIRRQTIDCLEAGMGSGGHIFCCNNAITSSVPLANYVAAVNAYRDYFGLARFTPAGAGSGINTGRA